MYKTAMYNIGNNDNKAFSGGEFSFSTLSFS